MTILILLLSKANTTVNSQKDWVVCRGMEEAIENNAIN